MQSQAQQSEYGRARLDGRGPQRKVGLQAGGGEARRNGVLRRHARRHGALLAAVERKEALVACGERGPELDDDDAERVDVRLGVVAATALHLGRHIRGGAHPHRHLRAVRGGGRCTGTAHHN